jgi:hypothetical protein
VISGFCIACYPKHRHLHLPQPADSRAYLNFRAIENQTVDHKVLEKLTKAEQALWVKYDRSPQGLGYRSSISATGSS